MRAFLAGMIAVVSLCAPARAAEGALSREGFLAALRAAQDRVSNIEYVVSAKRFTIESTSGEAKATPYFYNARIVMAGAPGGRMRYERNCVLPWHLTSTSPEQPIPMVDWFAFDGKTATTVAWRAVLGRTKVQTSPSWQTIRRARDSNELTMYECIPTALMLIPTYYQDAGLAQTIARFKDWRLTHNTDGTYVVRYTDALVFDRRITIDLNRGGAITGIVEGPEWYTSLEVRNIVLRDCGDGVWLPESAELRHYRELWRYSFSKVAINQRLPETVFRLELDKTRVVHDERLGIHYMPGTVEEWIKRYLVGAVMAVLSPWGMAATGAGAIILCVLVIRRIRRREK